MRVHMDPAAIRRRMRDLDITSLETLGETAGMPDQYIYRVLNGNTFTSTFLGRLATALECDPSELITTDDQLSARQAEAHTLKEIAKIEKTIEA